MSGEEKPEARNAESEAGPGPVPYARFKEVNDQRLALETAAQKAVEDAQKATSDLQAEKERAAQLTKDLEAERGATARLRVAAQKGIPFDLAERLQGQTAEEIAADADRLLPFIAKPPTSPGVPPAGGGQPPAPVDVSRMSPAQIRQAYDEGKLLK